MAQPATLIVKVFAKAFEGFVAVQADAQIAEAFYQNMADIFHNVQSLSGNLHKDVLKKRVVELFACALKICSFAISDREGTFSEYIRRKMFECMGKAFDILFQRHGLGPPSRVINNSMTFLRR